MIELTSVDEGVLLPVHAQPGARRAAIVGEHAGRLKVSVTAAPEKGKANRALLEVIASTLALRRSQLSLVSGESSSRKKVLVRDVTRGELARRIDECLNDTA